MTAYYNEIEPFAAAWLRNLIAAGHIAPGDVDERSIEDVRPDDLRGYTQCHFFAGIGVWSRALRLAGWPDDRRVWTGSCPCQPFSAAGKGAGFDDERHLWPAFHNLIAQCRPPAVLGEQVASSDTGPWVDLVHTDLEALGYAFGAVPFPSAGVGAPHIRDRLYWVADANYAGLEGWGAVRQRADQCATGQHGVAGGMADDNSDRCSPRGEGGQTMGHRQTTGADCGASGLADAAGDRQQRPGSRGTAEEGWQPRPECIGQLPDGFEGHDITGGIADAANIGQYGCRTSETGDGRNAARIESERLCDAGSGAGPTNGLWRAADWLHCRDGKWRPVEPGTFPLAHGASSQVGRLRAYGNAINAQAAQAFIEAYLGHCKP